MSKQRPKKPNKSQIKPTGFVFEDAPRDEALPEREEGKEVIHITADGRISFVPDITISELKDVVIALISDLAEANEAIHELRRQAGTPPLIVSPYKNGQST